MGCLQYMGYRCIKVLKNYFNQSIQVSLPIGSNPSNSCRWISASSFFATSGLFFKNLNIELDSVLIHRYNSEIANNNFIINITKIYDMRKHMFEHDKCLFIFLR